MPDVAIPEYVTRDYWWAYAHPFAVWLFDRQIAVNLILYGNYNRLRDRALEALGGTFSGRTLQVGCCYGNLTPHLTERIERAGGSLDVIDVLPIQLNKLASKLPKSAPVSLARMDAAMLSMPDATYDSIIMFLLLHEEPPEYRQKTMLEALRVLKPGGRIVIADYAEYAWWHPLRLYFISILQYLKPNVVDVFHHSLEELIPAMRAISWQRTSYFGGLFQLMVGEK